jgi:hypothetical protein
MQFKTKVPRLDVLIICWWRIAAGTALRNPGQSHESIRSIEPFPISTAIDDPTGSDFYRAGGGRRGDLAPRFSVGKAANNSQSAP